MDTRVSDVSTLRRSCRPLPCRSSSDDDSASCLVGPSVQSTFPLCQIIVRSCLPRWDAHVWGHLHWLCIRSPLRAALFSKHVLPIYFLICIFMPLRTIRSRHGAIESSARGRPESRSGSACNVLDRDSHFDYYLGNANVVSPQVEEFWHRWLGYGFDGGTFRRKTLWNSILMECVVVYPDFEHLHYLCYRSWTWSTHILPDTRSDTIPALDRRVCRGAMEHHGNSARESVGLLAHSPNNWSCDLLAQMDYLC